MRVIVVGTPAERARLRPQLDADGIDVLGEVASVGRARALARELAADAVVLAPEEREDAPLEEPLTPREVQVLELLAEGLSNRGIAGRLGISDQTVKFHVASISGKLGARSRT